MKKLSMAGLLPRGHREDRELAETKALAGQDGRHRRSLGKSKQVIFRTTPERHQQILRLAEALSAGRTPAVSMAETMERALDALEEKLKGRR